jgi:ubiquinone/menaquinone biosynthesis C-methylase UbiE
MMQGQSKNDSVRGSDFGTVDRSNDPKFFTNYLDVVSALDIVKQYKQQSFSALNARLGDNVLDIGCGTGSDVISLSSIVGKKGHVVGIDNSAVMIGEAQKRSHAAGLRNVEFMLGNAEHLDFADDTFDGCRSDRVLQHLNNPRVAILEMARVTKKGTGRIVAIDPDWDTLVVDSEYRDMTRKIVSFHSDQSRNGWSGRRLFGLLKEIGLVDISILSTVGHTTDFSLANQILELQSSAERAGESGVVSIEDAEKWLRDLRTKADKGRFFSGVSIFVIVGRKPP